MSPFVILLFFFGGGVGILGVEGTGEGLGRVEGAGVGVGRVEGAGFGGAGVGRVEGAGVRVGSVEGAGVRVGRVEGAGVGGAGVGEDGISASKMSDFPLIISCIFWPISFLEPAWINLVTLLYCSYECENTAYYTQRDKNKNM